MRVNKLQQYWWFNNMVNNAVHGADGIPCWFLKENADILREQ